MGAYCSIHNDTLDETVMVYLGVNTKVIKPLLWTITAVATAVSSGVASGMIPGVVGISTSTAAAAAAEIVISVNTLTAMAGGFVSTTNWYLDRVQNQIVADLSKGGYSKLLPGQTYTSKRRTIGLNLRVWIIRIQKTEHAILLRRTSASVFTNTVPGSTSVYPVLHNSVFHKWRNETIPIKEVIPREVTKVGSSSNATNTNKDDDSSRRSSTTQNNNNITEEEEEEYSLLETPITIVWNDEINNTNDDDTELSSSWVQINTVLQPTATEQQQTI